MLLGRVNLVAICVLLSSVQKSFTAHSSPVDTNTTRTAEERPNFLVFLADDLGWYDTSIHNPDALKATPALHDLAHKSGYILDHHYVFRYCSPTRRSLLTGRFPNHITSVQPDGDNLCSDFLPLNATILSEKLHAIGYKCHFIGKGHLGYQTTDHLPVRRGFDTHVGFLAGSESYHYGGGSQNAKQGKHDFWSGSAPGYSDVPNLYYATNFYTSKAVDLIEAYGERKRRNLQTHNIKLNRVEPFFMYFSVQNVHTPYQLPPYWETMKYPKIWNHTYANMLRILDTATLNVTKALRRTNAWNNTLILWTSDNGGIGLGNNYPLRGHKHDPWEGGTRAAAFLTGGFLPSRMQGTTSGPILIHVADWYPTFLHLAGVTKPSDRAYFHGNYEGANAGFYDIDGVNVWPMLTGLNTTQPRRFTPTSEVSIIDAKTHPVGFNKSGQHWWKLVTLAGQSNYWTKNQTSVIPTDPCLKGSQPDPKEPGRTDAIVTGCVVCNLSFPCLYDILADPLEEKNVAYYHEDVVTRLQKELTKFETQYISGRIDPNLLASKYERVPPKHWNGYLGPCYRRKTVLESEIEGKQH